MSQPINPIFASSALKVAPVQPAFGVNSKQVLAPMQVVNQYLKSAPKYQQLLGNLIKMEDSPQGYSHLKFAQDTALALVPKLLNTRSLAESTETIGLELLESFYLYYACGFLGQKVFAPLFKTFSKGANGLNNTATQQVARSLFQPVSKIPQAVLKAALPVKAAVILSGVLITNIMGNYGLHFAKNLATEYMFGKTRFSDIVNLSNGQAISKEKRGHSEVAKKAKQRLLLSAQISAGVLAASGLLAAFGGRFKGLQPALKRFVEVFDFSHKGGKLGLTRNHFIAALLPINLFGYFDAARDNLERVEATSRAAVVGGYLAIFGDMLKNHMVKAAAKNHPEIVNNQGRLNNLEVLGKTALDKAKKILGPGATVEQINAAALEFVGPNLTTKTHLYGVPLLIGLVGTGYTVSLLSRFWTKYRYEHEAQQQGRLAQQALNTRPATFAARMMAKMGV